MVNAKPKTDDAERKDMNEQYQPNERERDILDLLKEGRESGDPWGYTTASAVASALDTRRQYAHRSLGSLVTAGWVERTERGVYRFVADPRVSGDD